MKLAYILSLDSDLKIPFRGKWIWKLKTLPRIQTFIWKCMHKSIGVRDCPQQEGCQWILIVLFVRQMLK